MRGIACASVALASVACVCGAIASCGGGGATPTPSTAMDGSTPPTAMDGSVAGADATVPGSPADDGSASGDTSTGHDAAGDAGVGDVDAATACAAYASTYCTNFLKCDPRTFTDFYFDSIAQCQARIAQFCPGQFAAPGSAATPGSVARCAQEQSAQSCAEWKANSPASCFPKGSLTADAGCEYSSQCASTLCVRGPGLCGTCQDRVAVNGTCEPAQFNCQLGLVCADNCTGPPENQNCGGTMGSSCVPVVLDGGACDKEFECASGLACSQGHCAPLAGIGEPCVSWPQCAGDTTCLTQSVGSATCEPNSHSPEGGACDLAIGKECTGSSPCLAPNGMTTSSGNCGPEPVDGQNCTFSDECLYPAVCDHGTCRPPDDATGCK